MPSNTQNSVQFKSIINCFVYYCRTVSNFVCFYIVVIVYRRMLRSIVWLEFKFIFNWIIIIIIIIFIFIINIIITAWTLWWMFGVVVINSIMLWFSHGFFFSFCRTFSFKWLEFQGSYFAHAAYFENFQLVAQKQNKHSSFVRNQNTCTFRCRSIDWNQLYM